MPNSFCNQDCKEAYREERIKGTPAPQPLMLNGIPVSHLKICAHMKICAHCATKLEA